MKYTIYKITNLINEKIYIGQHKTINIDDGYMGSGVMLKRAYKKYGQENFFKEILFEFDTYDEMVAKELELVNEAFVRRSDTYNLTEGGGDGFEYINRMGLNNQNKDWVAIQAKIRLKTKGVKRPWMTEEMILRHKNGLVRYDTFTGKSHTEETKRKMSESAKGKHNGSKNSQFGSMWITDGNKNQKIKRDETMPDGWYKGRKIK